MQLRSPVAVVAVVVVLAVLASEPALATEPQTPAVSSAPVEPAACRGALDAVHTATERCASPATLSAGVVADAVVVDAPLRDPRIFPGELAFGAVVVAAAGGVTLGVTSFSPPTSAELATGLQVGGVVALGLSGLLAGAAVSFAVFNPTTGALQVPWFEGEAR